jgi:2-desacetyl-2-hydroxyethyl bacteriochlorophyllide A dehydrogenase
MRAIRLEDSVVVREDLPMPSLGPGEALVRLLQAGICATDLELVRGYLPFRGTLGHEFVGVVVEAADAPAMVGQRVVGEINLACGDCFQCRRGRPTHCDRRQVLGIRGRDGAFAEYLSLPLGNLHPVPDSISDEAAVFTEPLAAALAILQQVAIQPDDRVLVVGAGRLGQLIARVLRLTGCDLSVVARHPRQRELLAVAGVAGITEDAVAGRRSDLVVEATGSPGGLALAKRAVRPCGTIVLKSTYKGSIEMDFSALVVDEIRLVGSRCGPFPAALRLLEQGLVDPLPLVDSRFPLQQGIEALRLAAKSGRLKVLLHP